MSNPNISITTQNREEGEKSMFFLLLNVKASKTWYETEHNPFAKFICDSNITSYLFQEKTKPM